MTNYKFILPLFATTLLSSLAIAQDTTSIATEKLEVIKNYEAIIQQAIRKDIQLKQPQIEEKAIIYQYKLSSEAQLDFDRPSEIIRPITYKSDSKNKDVKDGNFYASSGNFRSLGVGGAYHYYIEDWLDLGFKADHFSAKDNSLPHQKYNTTSGTVYGSYFLGKQTKLGAEMRYLGYDHFSPVVITEDSLSATEQSFSSYGGAVQFSSNLFEKAGTSIRSKIDYDILKQTIDDTREKRFKAELNILKKINDRIAFELPLEFRNYNLSFDSLNERSASDIILRPNLRIRDNRYSVRAGMEYINADSSNFIFPIIDIRIENIYGGISARLFTSSNYHRNSMHYLSSVNPYYQTLTTGLTVNYLRSYGLELSRNWLNLKLSLKGSYNNYTGDDMHIDRAFINRAIVSSIDRNEWQVQPAVHYSNTYFDIDLSYQLNIFVGDSKDNLFYRPKSVLKLHASENLLSNRVKFIQELNYVSARNTAHPSDDDGVLDSALDLSLTLDVQIVKNVNIFARASNLLKAEYELWYGHPVFERQIWGGIRFNL